MNMKQKRRLLLQFVHDFCCRTLLFWMTCLSICKTELDTLNDNSSLVNARSVKHDESKLSEKSCEVWLRGSSVTTALLEGFVLRAGVQHLYN